MSDKIVNWFYANKVQYLNIILFQISEFVIDTEIFFFIENFPQTIMLHQK